MIWLCQTLKVPVQTPCSQQPLSSLTQQIFHNHHLPTFAQGQPLHQQVCLLVYTKEGVSEVSWGVRGELGCVRGELGCVRGEMGCVRGELGCVRGELRCVRGEVGSVRGELRCVRGELRCVRGELGCVKKVKDDLKWIAVLVYKSLPFISSFIKVLCLSLISSMSFGARLRRKNSPTGSDSPTSSQINIQP